MKLFLTLGYGQDQVETKRSFDELLDKEDAFVSCERTLWRRWQLTYHLEQLTAKQVEWILLHLDGNVLSARVETRNVGMIGKVYGGFGMVMRRR